MKADDVPRKSLYREAFRETVMFRLRNAGSFKDPGKEWNRRHWWDWAKKCWVQHMRGSVFWMELGTSDFALVDQDILGNRNLVEGVLNRLEEGHENLDIINWAMGTDANVDEVVSILERLDINSRRDEMRNTAP